MSHCSRIAMRSIQRKLSPSLTRVDQHPGNTADRPIRFELPLVLAFGAMGRTKIQPVVFLGVSGSWRKIPISLIDPVSTTIATPPAKHQYFGNTEISFLSECLSNRRKVRWKDCVLSAQSLVRHFAGIKQPARVTTFSHTIAHASPFDSG
jgi:hypothetical protein